MSEDKDSYRLTMPRRASRGPRPQARFRKRLPCSGSAPNLPHGSGDPPNRYVYDDVRGARAFLVRYGDESDGAPGSASRPWRCHPPRWFMRLLVWLNNGGAEDFLEGSPAAEVTPVTRQILALRDRTHPSVFSSRRRVSWRRRLCGRLFRLPSMRRSLKTSARRFFYFDASASLDPRRARFPVRSGFDRRFRGVRPPESSRSWHFTPARSSLDLDSRGNHHGRHEEMG